MRKHYKLISSIVCLLLCVSMIAFGVYAATHSLIGVSSQVSFTPTTAKLKIFGAIADHKEYVNNANSGKYYACNYGVNGDEGHYKTETINEIKTDKFAEWKFDAIHFNDNYDESAKELPPSIYFYIQITNYVERNVKYSLKLDKNTNGKLEEKITLRFGYYKISNDSDELKDKAMATSKGWWSINDIDSSLPAFHNKNPKLGEGVIKYVEKDNATETVNFYGTGENAVDTTLSTMMIVIKMDVKSDEESFSDVNFNFTLSAI